MSSARAFRATQAGFLDVADVSTTENRSEVMASVRSKLNLSPSTVAVSTFDETKGEFLFLDASTTEIDEVGLLLKHQVNSLCPDLQWCPVAKDTEHVGGSENARPPWQTASQCYDCGVSFTWGIPGLIQPVNRHHCRNCGASACDAHSMHTMLLPALGYELPERVCDKCWSLAAPEQKGVSSVTEELSFIEKVISEAQNCKKASELASESMLRLELLMKALGESHTQTVQESQVAMSSTKSKLLELRRMLDDVVALGKSDLQQGATTDLEQSVINFSYSSPKLRRLATELDPFVQNTEIKEASLKTLSDLFDDLIAHDALKVTEAIAESSIEVAKLDSHQWVEVFGQKITELQETAEEVQLLSRRIEFDSGNDQTLSDAHNRTLKIRYDMRTMVVHVVESTIESAKAVTHCGSMACDATNALQKSRLQSGQIYHALEQTAMCLSEWKDRRAVIVAQGHRKDILRQGNFHHKLSQKVKALEGENLSLKSRLESLTKNTGEIEVWNQERQKYESKIEDLMRQLDIAHNKPAEVSEDWTQQRELLTNRIDVLESELARAQMVSMNVAPQEKNREDFTKLLEDAHKQIRALTAQLEELKKASAEKKASDTKAKERLTHEITSLREANEMLQEQLNTEMSLNQRHIADLTREKKASEVAASSAASRNKFILDERDAIRSHLEQLLDHQRKIEEEAEAMKNRGYSAEVSLIHYHEALVSIYQSVHPAGGRADETLFALTENSTLPQKTTSLVGDFVSASSLIQSRFEVLEEELEQALEKIRVLESGSIGSTQLSESTTGAEEAVPGSEMPDVPRYSAEIMQLRAMGFDAPRSRLVEVLEQCNGELQDAANELLN